MPVTVTLFDRITMEPGKMGGKACIRGMRIPVSLVLSFLAAGSTIEEILDDYPDLEREDIQQCLAYAAYLASDERIPLAVVEA